MPVRIEYGLAEDQKPQLNNDPTMARYIVPHLVKIQFIDDKTGSVMFTFAPTFEHMKQLEEAFNLINEYDVKRMELFRYIKQNEMGELQHG